MTVCLCVPFTHDDIISSVIRRNQCNNIKGCSASLTIKDAYENIKRPVFIEYWQQFKRQMMLSIGKGNGLPQIYGGNIDAIFLVSIKQCSKIYSKVCVCVCLS